VIRYGASLYRKKQQYRVRAAYSPDGFANCSVTGNNEVAFSVRLSSVVGEYDVEITWPALIKPFCITKIRGSHPEIY
jgi:hypothetical protein